MIVFFVLIAMIASFIVLVTTHQAKREEKEVKDLWADAPEWKPEDNETRGE